eukprot:m.68578 g.68578  ORF g.68578 m.68578 type:complete len:354 (-) comp11979_c0_seq2:80-1141(-)
MMYPNAFETNGRRETSNEQHLAKCFTSNNTTANTEIPSTPTATTTTHTTTTNNSNNKKIPPAIDEVKLLTSLKSLITTKYNCVGCGLETKTRRKGPQGNTLCNACGIRYLRHKIYCKDCYHVPKHFSDLIDCCPKCQGRLVGVKQWHKKKKLGGYRYANSGDSHRLERKASNNLLEVQEKSFEQQRNTNRGTEETTTARRSSTQAGRWQSGSLIPPPPSTTKTTKTIHSPQSQQTTTTALQNNIYAGGISWVTQPLAMNVIPQYMYLTPQQHFQHQMIPQQQQLIHPQQHWQHGLVKLPQQQQLMAPQQHPQQQYRAPIQLDTHPQQQHPLDSPPSQMNSAFSGYTAPHFYFP